MQILFPTSLDDIRQRAEKATVDLRSGIKRLLVQVVSDPRSLKSGCNQDDGNNDDGGDDTVCICRQFDQLVARFQAQTVLLDLCFNMAVSAQVRQLCQQLVAQLSQVVLREVWQNVDLYQALSKHEATTEHSVSGQYFLHRILREFEQLGVDLFVSDLPRAQRVQSLLDQLVTLDVQFSANISEQQRSITIHDRRDLAGLSDAFVASLPSTNTTSVSNVNTLTASPTPRDFVLGTDYATVDQVMNSCSVEETRRRLYVAFGQRAYPDNLAILQQIVQVRHEAAQLLGYSNWAEYELSDETARRPAHVDQFLDVMLSASKHKAAAEYLDLYLPGQHCIHPNEPNKRLLIEPWNVQYILKQAERELLFDASPEWLSEHFPLSHVLEVLFETFADWFDVCFRRVAALDPAGLEFLVPQSSNNKSSGIVWLEATRRSDVLGHVILDLHPRPGKYSHAANWPVVKRRTSKNQAAFAAILTNFPAPLTEGGESLLLFEQVETLFHEMGHAMQHVLDHSPFASIDIVTDMVEMPSQLAGMLVWDRRVLSRLGRHYLTCRPLPTAVIDRLSQRVRTLDSGYFVGSQVEKSKISLDLFRPTTATATSPSPRMLEQFVAYWQARCLPWLRFERRSHMLCGFGHLADYGARYYAYLWSNVAATHLYLHLAQSPSEEKRRFVATVLARGTALPIFTLLRQYLEPVGQWPPHIGSLIHHLALTTPYISPIVI